MMYRLFERLLFWVAPRSAHEWLTALLCEVSHLESRDRPAWYFAAAWLAITARTGQAAFYLEAIALGVIMVAVDWTSGALIPALALIGLSAVILTRGSARQSHAALLVSGATLPLAHAMANWLPRLRPHYQYAPLGLMDWVILAAVATIGLCAVRIANALWRAWDRAIGDC